MRKRGLRRPFVGTGFDGCGGETWFGLGLVKSGGVREG